MTNEFKIMYHTLAIVALFVAILTCHTPYADGVPPDKPVHLKSGQRATPPANKLILQVGQYSFGSYCVDAQVNLDIHCLYMAFYCGKMVTRINAFQLKSNPAIEKENKHNLVQPVNGRSLFAVNVCFG